jgi:hypothetical protein
VALVPFQTPGRTIAALDCPRPRRGEHHRLERHIPRVTGRDENTSEIKPYNVLAPDDRFVEGDMLIVGSQKRPEDLMEKGAE